MMVKKEYSYIKDLAIKNIEIIFRYFDIEYENRYSYLTCACPLHGGKNKTGFSFSLERRTWRCWSTGNDCNDIYNNDIFGLIMGIKDIKFIEAVSLLCQILGVDNKKIPALDKETMDNKKFCKNIKSKKNKKIIYPSSCLKKLQNDTYFLNRGFKKETLEHFQCGIARRGKMTNRVVFPIIDMNDDIVGFTGRIIFEKCKDCGEYHDNRGCGNGFVTNSKWKKSTSLSKTTVIYNLSNAYNEIVRKKELIIVEGIPDVMRLHQVGVNNVICILGTVVSIGQIRLLLSVGYICKVFLFTDNDVAGKNFKNKHSTYDEDDLSSLSRYFNVEKVEAIGYKDIGDMNDNEATSFCRSKGWI